MDPRIPIDPEDTTSSEEFDDTVEPRGPLSGFLSSFSALFVTLLEMAYTRLELIFVDLQESLEDVVSLLLWGFAGLVALGIALFIGALALIFAFWETHRVLVSVLLMGGFLTFAVTAGLVVASKIRSRGNLFATTLREFARDRAYFKSRR